MVVSIRAVSFYSFGISKGESVIRYFKMHTTSSKCRLVEEGPRTWRARWAIVKVWVCYILVGECVCVRVLRRVWLREIAVEKVENTDIHTIHCPPHVSQLSWWKQSVPSCPISRKSHHLDRTASPLCESHLIINCADVRRYTGREQMNGIVRHRHRLARTGSGGQCVCVCFKL